MRLRRGKYLYGSAVTYKDKHSDEDVSEWVAWANAKADWYDPTISLEDGLLGKREHAKDKENKKLKHAGYWW